MDAPTLTAQRLAGLLTNPKRPRPKLIRALTNDGPRDWKVPQTGQVKALVGAVLGLNPIAVEIYGDKDGTELLTRIEGHAGEIGMPEVQEIVPNNRLRGERLLMLYAQLLEKAHRSANTNQTAIVGRITSLLNKLEERAARWEQTAQQLHEALVMQTQGYLNEREKNLAEREAAVETNEGTGEELVGQFIAGMAQGKSAAASAGGVAATAAGAHTNGTKARPKK